MAGLIAVVLVATACSAAPTASNTGSVSSAVPTASATPTAEVGGTSSPSGAATTPAGTAGPTPPSSLSNLCAAVPTIDPNNPSSPSGGDPQLEAHFPTAIDGQPVTDASSGSFVQFACLDGGVTLRKLQGTAAYDLLQLTWGSATATVDGDTLELFAYRLPGADANELVPTLAGLAEATGGDPNIISIGNGTAGGKQVIVAQNQDRSMTYGFVSGDTLITADDITQAQADKIFSVVK